MGCVLLGCKIFRRLCKNARRNLILQGDSLARGHKLLSIKNCQSIKGWWANYWVLPTRRCNTSHFKCQHARNWKFFFKRELSQKRTFGHPDLPIWRLTTLGPIEGAKCTKIHPAQSDNSKTPYAKRFKPSKSTFWGKYSRIWEKRIQVCLDVKGDQFQHRLWAGPVLHRSRYVYINFQVIISIT